MVRPDGPIPANILILGDAPTTEDERQGLPFSGPAGQELNRMLGEAGISRSECFLTNVCRTRLDPASLIASAKKDTTSAHTEFNGKYVLRPLLDGAALVAKEIQMVKPKMVLSLGNIPLWCLTGLYGITRWRGSMLVSTPSMGSVKVIPTYHPAAILRQWDWRAIAVNDFRRAARFRRGEAYPDPGWRFTVRPTFKTACAALHTLLSRVEVGPTPLSFDIETKLGHIDCAAIAWTIQDAICIPFMGETSRDHYWSIDEEATLTHLLSRLLTHPNAQVVGQNLLYDSQYTYRWWHFIPNVWQDTMISHHVTFAGLPKKLDFQASMYCDHYVQWKPDRGQWKEGG